MNRGDTPRKGSGLTPAGPAFDTPLRNEEELLDGLLTLSAKGQLRPETWDALHAAARRDGRLAEVAFAYESVSQGKRLKALSGAPVAEFLYEAGRFFGDVFGDELGAVSYLERAYAALPAHQPTFDRLLALLLHQGNVKKAAELYAGAASHRARADELEYLRKAAELYEQATGFDDKVIDLLQQITRLDATDEAARTQLEARYVKANRMRDVARLLDQALSGDPPPVGRAARKIHSRLLDVYANQLHEPERSIAHVEAILAEDPSDDEARKVAQKLVVVKGLAARAASALAIALTAVGGTPPEIARFLAIELEHTRGPKRRDVLLRVGILKQERMNDDKGAFEAFEQALAVDAADGVLRTRYAALASKMKKQLDAAKTLSRVSASVKLPAQKAHLHAVMGELLLEGGEAKRAKATFVAVLASPEAGPEATLTAGMALAGMLETENDPKALADVLDRVAEVEPDPVKARAVNERLAAVAAHLGDARREIAAWQRLVDTPARATALASLEPLYEASGDAILLASLLEERSKDATSVGEARRLAVKAAEARTQKGDAGSGAAWRSIVERFGPARDAYASWIPILETERDWAGLAAALESDASLTPGPERAEVLARLGNVYLQRLKDVPAAIQAFRGALAQEPTEKSARAALEKIAAAGEHRLAAAAVLEPVYRADENHPALVKLLDLKATEAPTADDRLAALEEAVALTAPSEPAQAMELAGRALAEAVANGFAVAPWLERIASFASRGVEPKRRATLLTNALGDRAIDSADVLALARDTGDALAAAGDPDSALAVYRRALAFEPGAADLITRVDDLLRDRGDPRERIALYRAALARGANAGRRRTLLHQIATIERDHLHDASAAAATYAGALADDPDDSEAHDALSALLAQMERWPELCDLLDIRARRAVGGEMRQARARLADVAASHGDPERAVAQCRILLADPALVSAELDVVDRVARTIGDPLLARDALRTRASSAADPRTESAYLERIGEIECEELSDFDAAAATWKRAAAVAEMGGDDERARELYSRARKIAPDDLEATTRLAELCERVERWGALPPLYALLVERAPDATAKVELLCKIARIIADKLGDPAQAALQAARAFEIAPRDRAVIALLETLCIASGSAALFEHAVDETILRSSDGSDDEASQRFDLRLARARVLAAEPSRADDAAAAFRSLVEEKALDLERRAAALAGLESLVVARGPTRRDDARWLFEWKLAHAEEGYRVQILLGWARAEEESLGDPKSALEIYRRVLLLDDDDADALTATSRLALTLGDVEGALSALTVRRDRSEGGARATLDLEIAKILLDATNRYNDALACVRGALDAMPTDAGAIGLAARLLAIPSTSASIVEALDRAIEASDDPESRARILSTLLEGPKDAAPGDARLRWYDRLLDLHEQRAETEAEIALIARAANELPLSEAIWDRAERIARTVQRPDEVATLYERALYGSLAKSDAMALAQRAVAFYEEWFDAPARIVTILERVLDIDPTAEWAFDRLKLLFDAAERWDDLFALFDRALEAVRGPRRVELLEDAAQIAKDFAGRPDRATGYLEQLLVIHPNDARLSASLERLYERQSRHRELVALLSARAPTLAAAEAHATRARIASLWVDDLKDPAAALGVVEEILDLDASAQPQAVTALLERILGAAPLGLEMPAAATVPPRGSEPPPKSRRAKGRVDSVAPSAKRATSVRQRAAALLKERYGASGQEANLVRILEVEIEAVKSVKERIRRHQQIALLYEQLANDADAMEHWIALVTLEPDVASHRVRLTELAEKVDRFDRLADVLAAAADEAHDEDLRVELLMQAGLVHADRIGDGDRAIELFLRILDAPAASKGATLAAARRVAPLLEAAARPRDRLAVLERIATLEPDADARREASGTAARLAESIGEPERAVAAWRSRLDEDGSDLEALDALVLLLGDARDFDALIDVLGKRAKATRDPERRRADFVRMATVHETDRARIDDAIAMWRALEAEFGEADDQTVAMSRLLRAAEEWADVAVVLARGAERAADDRTRTPFLRDLGDVQRERLEGFDEAVVSYTGALRGDPTDAGARAGLHALLPREAQRPGSVDALVAAYTATDEWTRMLELVPYRLLTARDAPAKLAVLLQAAELSETRAGDPSLAFEAMRRAFLVSPENERVATELARLAEATNGWRGYVDTHHEAIAALDAAGGAADVVATLRMRSAQVLDARLGDARAALTGYLQILAESPASLDAARAAIEVAARLSRWDAAAKVIADASRSLGALDASLLATAEASASQPAAWDALTSALAATIADRGDLAVNVSLGLEAKIAEWHRDRRGDPEAAEAAYQRALSHDALHAEILGALAQLQRRNRGRPLVDSLLRLSQATGGDLDLLREASEIALVSVGDRALAKTILDKLVSLARERWLGSETSTSVSLGAPAAPAAYVEWALGELVRVYETEGEHARVIDLYVSAAELPFALDARRAYRHRAAEAALDRIGDSVRAGSLYDALFDEDPDDARAVEQLVVIYASRPRDLLALRQRQIVAAGSIDRRVELRLDAARLFVELGERDRAASILRENLDESPRDSATLAALVATLEAREKYDELRDLLRDQATRAEAAGENAAAADLWHRAAIVAEERLGDRDGAISFHGRVITLEPRAASFDALARLAAARGDHARAADHLESLRRVATHEERARVTLRLADALAASGNGAAAQARLEEETQADPAAEDIRTRLALLYKEQRQWPELARLLTVAAAHAPDKAARLARLREAASLFRNECAAPAEAVPLLEQASDLVPGDQTVRLALADALGAAQRYDDARALLIALVEAFGGRRPKERAPVHYQLAQLELAMGNRARALVELDAATRIDPASPEILRTLAELARDDGQLERAERSYRALLVVLRRQDEAAEASIARSEVLLELSAIAAQQGENDRATEILESALEAAARSDLEEERLEVVLTARGDFKTLARALEARVARGGESPKALGDLARLLGEQLGRPADALPIQLRALSASPSSAAIHDATAALARRLGSPQRYIDAVDLLVAKAERAGDADLASSLLLRLGEAAENELRDPARATAIYERALAFDFRVAEILRALDRIHSRSGDAAAQAAVLARLVDVESRVGDTKAKTDAIYRLAALRLASPATVDEGCDLLADALRTTPDFDRAEQALKTALATAPQSERALDLYESIGRNPGRERTLVDALARRAAVPRAGGDALREAVAVARQIPDLPLAESLLERVVEQETSATQNVSFLAWATETLAELREAAGDMRRAVELKRAAASLAEPEEARRLSFEVARMAVESLGDLRLAAETYESLRTRDPADREVWEPLLDVYRKLGDNERLSDLLAAIVEYVEDPRERSRLRLERVRILNDEPRMGDDAVQTLREIVDEDPSQIEAAMMLANVLEREGREDDLADLLGRQLDAAKDRGDAASVASLAMRLGKLLEKRNRLEARNVYYAGLEWDASSRELLGALRELLEVDGDPSDRADVSERLLALTTGSDAERLALDLAALRTDAQDDDGAERALEAGFKAYPASVAMRARLEARYREKRAFEKLAELCVVDAATREDPDEKVARLREAAGVYRDDLRDVANAARVLEIAIRERPAAPGLLNEVVVALIHAGDLVGAERELSDALERQSPESFARAAILAKRAHVRQLRADDQGALGDLEEAFAVGAAEHAPALGEQLERSVTLAAGAGDIERARALRLRLADVLAHAGTPAAARAILDEMLKGEPRDRDALRALARLEEAGAHWDAASAVYRRLVALEEDPAVVVETALKLADACERAERFGDARGGLERARMIAPSDAALRKRLEDLYARTGAVREQAELYLADARDTGDVAARFELLVQAGGLLMQEGGDLDAAIAALTEARALRPNEHESVALLADAFTLAGKMAEATELLNEAIGVHKGRRSRELASLYHRLARVASATGDSQSELAWLTQALDMDSQNGDVAAELATVAIATNQLDLANRALRVVTMLKAPGPMSKASAYQYMGVIARTQGDAKRAVMLLKRAVQEDPSLDEARALLESLQGS